MRDDMLSELRNQECNGGAANLVVYDDATGRPILPGDRVQGHPTIGIGRALDTHGISPAEAVALFVSDVAAAERGLLAALPWLTSISDVRRDVFTDMAFQMGVNGVLAFRIMLGAAVTGDWTGAAAAMLDSEWARQMRRFGSTRALRLSAQLRTGSAAAQVPDGRAPVGV